MEPAILRENKNSALETLSTEHIVQSKYILNAALIEVLRDKNPRDVRAAKKVIFEILESENSDFDAVKYTLIDGRFLDAADELVHLASRALEYAGDLYLKAGVIYLPFLSVKALDAFEKAIDNRADLTGHHGQVAALYRRMGDEAKSKKHEELSLEFNEEPVSIAGNSVAQDRANQAYASDVKILPLTLVRDSRRKFAPNLKLDD